MASPRTVTLASGKDDLAVLESRHRSGPLSPIAWVPVRAEVWGRVRLPVENGVAAPTRVHTIPKGAWIMVISTGFSISTDGYEESNA